MKRFVYLVVVMICFSPAPVNASDAIKKFRQNFQKAADAKVNKLFKAGHEKSLRGLCQPIFSGVLDIDNRVHCSANCSGSINEQTAELTSFNSSLIAKFGAARKFGNGVLAHPSILRACLRISIADRNERVSYGVARMAVSDGSDSSKFMVRSWLATSLALGKGIQVSKPAARKVFLDIATSDGISKEAKTAIARIALTM